MLVHYVDSCHTNTLSTDRYTDGTSLKQSEATEIPSVSFCPMIETAGLTSQTFKQNL